MKIIDSHKEFFKFLENESGTTHFIIPIYCAEYKSLHESDISLLYVYSILILFIITFINFFFKIFLEIINLEVLFKIIPFFKRLTGLRSKGSFQYEFTLNIFKILMNGLQEKLITRILYC